MDGCNSYHTHEILDPAYIFMGDALNKTERPVLYSCSWPDYIRTNSSGTDPSTTATRRRTATSGECMTTSRTPGKA